jgi:hypothetical protein
MTLRDPVDRELSWYYFRANTIRKTCAIFGTNCATMLPQWLRNQNILNSDGTGIKPFEEVMNQTVINTFLSGNETHPDRQYGLYANHLKKWFKYFDRKSQILLLSFDELNTDQPSFLHRINEFLNLPKKDQNDLSIGHWNKSPRIIETNKTRSDKTRSAMCDTLLHLKELYNESVYELYDLLEKNPGPPMEQRPFPKFKYNPPCGNQTNYA